MNKIVDIYSDWYHNGEILSDMGYVQSEQWMRDNAGLKQNITSHSKSDYTYSDYRYDIFDEDKFMIFMLKYPEAIVKLYE